jgi:mRNA-degrading endonuclease RelE of RelBE toxin-antitoxin system
MVFTLQLSHTAQKALDKLPPNVVKKIYHHLEEVARDPYRPRPKADIVPVAGSQTLYRMRVGKLRVEYEVCNDENIIKIAKIFQKKRKSDYR